MMSDGDCNEVDESCTKWKKTLELNMRKCGHVLHESVAYLLQDPNLTTWHLAEKVNEE